MKKSLFQILIVHVLIVAGFTSFFLGRGNYEFMLYIGVIVLLTLLVWRSMKYVQYSVPVLWGMVLWSLLHLSGGGLTVGEGVLYQWIMFPLSDNYPILRFDQFVHAYGFGVTVFLLNDVAKPFVNQKAFKSWGLTILLVTASAGLGALNEVVEFFATVVSPSNGVGDYTNNALDLVFNFIGAIIAVSIIRWKRI